MKRSYVRFIGYDGTSVKLPISKSSFWFTKSHGPRCVVGCKNYPDMIHLSNNGLATMAYCEAHAKLRIYHNLVNGWNERGVWCFVEKGRLRTLPIYKEIIKTLRNSVYSDRKFLTKLKTIEVKISGVKI